jgi:hypothetical protein
MIFSYDPTKLASGVPETSLVIAYYSVSEGQWIILGGVVDTVNHTITVQVDHFTAFAVITRVTRTTPTPIPTLTPAQTPTPTPTPTPTQLSWWLIAGIIVVSVAAISIIVRLVAFRRRSYK